MRSYLTLPDHRNMKFERVKTWVSTPGIYSSPTLPCNLFSKLRIWHLIWEWKSKETDMLINLSTGVSSRALRQASRGAARMKALSREMISMCTFVALTSSTGRNIELLISIIRVVARFPGVMVGWCLEYFYRWIAPPGIDVPSARACPEAYIDVAVQ